jgi:LPXTG-motif cell wall-anchored protein
MRREFRALAFAGILGACAAPVGASPAEDARDTAASQAPVAVQRVAVPSTGMRDEAAMVLVGTMLIGLAAAVRRAA